VTPPDPKGTDMAYPNEVGRVRVILDCDWNDLRHALDTVIDAKPMFDRSGRGIGWDLAVRSSDQARVFSNRALTPTTGGTDMTESELKPCPFCGGEARTRHIRDGRQAYCRAVASSRRSGRTCCSTACHRLQPYWRTVDVSFVGTNAMSARVSCACALRVIVSVAR
jgi:hypothetical protein